jgi:hypothetical protein
MESPTKLAGVEYSRLATSKPRAALWCSTFCGSWRSVRSAGADNTSPGRSTLGVGPDRSGRTCGGPTRNAWSLARLLSSLRPTTYQSSTCWWRSSPSTAGPSVELEPLVLARFGPGDWQTEAWDVEPVRYLAEMRATLRLTVSARDAATGRTQEKRFYAKVYHDEEKAKQTHEVLQALWEKSNADGESFSVGRPVVYLDELRTSIQEEIAGIPLRDVLLEEDRAIPVVRKVARARAALHLGQMVTPRRRYPQRDIAIVEQAGKLLPLACPHLRSEIREIVGAIVAGLEEVPPAPTHCDLSPSHIMLDGDRLYLVDLDEFAGADPMLDVARFLTPLATAPLRLPLPRDRGQAAARAFVEEYFAHAPEAWRARLPVHYAIAVLKMANGFFRRQQPGFPDKIEVLVREARKSLAGEVW